MRSLLICALVMTVAATWALAQEGPQQRPVPPTTTTATSQAAELPLPADGFAATRLQRDDATMAKADTQIIGVFDHSTELAKVRDADGKWETRYYLVRYRVAKAVQGSFKPMEFSFVVTDRWPTPGSGIMVKKAQFSFRFGTAYLLGLKSNSKTALPAEVAKKVTLSESPFEVIAYQTRSVVPPYDKPVPSDLGPKHQDKDKLLEAIDDKLDEHKSLERQGANFTEQTETDHVVIITGRDRQTKEFRGLILLIDKKTFKVRELNETTTKPAE